MISESTASLCFVVVSGDWKLFQDKKIQGISL